MLLTLVMSPGWANAQESQVRERARRYEPLIAAAAARYVIDPYLLWTIAYQETRFQPGLISLKGARGLMQFMPATAVRYHLLNPHDPAQAIDAAAHYVRDLNRRFNGNLRLILAAYNSGEGTVEAYRSGRKLVLPTGKVINAAKLRTDGVPPYRETQGYVTGGSAIYQRVVTANIFNAPLRQGQPMIAPPVEAEDDETLELERSTDMRLSAEASATHGSTLNIVQTSSPANQPIGLPAQTRSIYIP